jgi:hypothetical protein
VLNVRDLAAECSFYDLCLPVIYEDPDSSAFGTETLHFGIQTAPAGNDPPSVLTWQIGVTEIDRHGTMPLVGHQLRTRTQQPCSRIGLPLPVIGTSSGYRLALEGPTNRVLPNLAEHSPEDRGR